MIQAWQALPSMWATEMSWGGKQGVIQEKSALATWLSGARAMTGLETNRWSKGAPRTRDDASSSRLVRAVFFLSTYV
jgi:hypothetical protein